MSTKNLNDILENGEKKAHEFISRGINSYDVHLKATIKKNQDAIFAKKPAQNQNLQQIKTLKTDVALFSRLFIASEVGMLILMIFFVMKIKVFLLP